eukprot:3862139-Pleurochrysis_carterae.AAC.5
MHSPHDAIYYLDFLDHDRRQRNGTQSHYPQYRTWPWETLIVWPLKKQEILRIWSYVNTCEVANLHHSNDALVIALPCVRLNANSKLTAA